MVAIERTREFRGRYHVLGGAISPIDGIGPDQLRIRELMVRLADGTITEVILATDPNLEGGDGDVPHPHAPKPPRVACDAAWRVDCRRWRPGVRRRGDPRDARSRKAIR